jgi:predicted PurR-regulated permease PerM
MDYQPPDNAVKTMLAVICTILVIAALKATDVIMVPLVFSAFVAFLLTPPIRWLKAHAVPPLVTSVVSVLVVVGALFLALDIIQMSVTNLSERLPEYQTKFDDILKPLLEKLRKWGVKEDYITEIQGFLSPTEIGDYLSTGMWSLFSIMSDLLLIFFITLFMLIEAHSFKEKIVEAFGERTALPEWIEEIGRDVYRYVALKTAISLLTGAVVWLFLAVVRVEFSFLWGVWAFALNFIPNIGSVIATIPPVLLAILQSGESLWFAALVLGGLTVIQVSIGFFLDPRIMGKGLRLSALVVFLAMVFFGWLWGIVGVLLSVPLIGSLKVIFSHLKPVRPISILLEE